MLTLDDLYKSNEDSYFLHEKAFVQGVIMGACACPEIPLPDDWLPLTIAKHNEVKDNEQADRVFTGLFEYFRYLLSEMRHESVDLPANITFVLGSQNQEIQSFFSGLLHAHQKYQSVWQNAWHRLEKTPLESIQISADESKDSNGNEEIQKAVSNEEKVKDIDVDLKHCLMMFSTFADIPLAIEKAKTRGKQDFDQDLSKLSLALPKVFKRYIEIAGLLAMALPNQFETFSKTPE